MSDPNVGALGLKLWPSFELPPADAFAPEVSEALVYAADEADAHGHNYVGSEHIFLGCVRVGSRVVPELSEIVDLNELAVRVMQISSELVDPSEGRLQRAQERRSLPLDHLRVTQWAATNAGAATPRVRTHLRRSVVLAREQNGPAAHSKIEHVLFAICEDEDGVVRHALGEDETEARLVAWLEQQIAWGGVALLFENPGSTA